MILAEAIEFSKQFPSCHPKIFKGFIERQRFDDGTQGYVVLTSLADQTFPSQMEDYVKKNKLKIERFKDYWVICTL